MKNIQAIRVHNTADVTTCPVTTVNKVITYPLTCKYSGTYGDGRKYYQGFACDPFGTAPVVPTTGFKVTTKVCCTLT